MKTDLATSLRALTPGDILSEYKKGRRDFSLINLFRHEIETFCENEQYLDCLEHRDIARYNALWVDFRIGTECNFEWDRFGRCLSIHPDLPPLRDLSQSSLPNINLSGAYLYPVDFSHTDLSGADLRRAIFIDCSLSNTCLNKADLRDSILMNCNIDNADFYMARMDRARLIDCNAANANFRGAKLYRTRLSGVTFNGASLDHARCDRIKLDYVDFRNSDLLSVKFRDARVGHIIISEEQEKHLLSALGVDIINQEG